MDDAQPAHLDVLIVGAGLSGVGAAAHLARDLPDVSYAVLESREAIGGTWDLFRYPGVRSDSDMFTLGYRFKPWTGEKALADGPSIREYVRETAREYGVEQRVRFRHRVTEADWSSADQRWTVTCETPEGPVELTCGFLWAASGYYRYDQGYLPEFAGIEDFAGQVVHPQHWPEGLDYSGKRVVVIGSGATAVTLVPSMTEGDGAAAHVTMLQRSPSYILTLPARDELAVRLRKVLPDQVAYGVTRWKNVVVATGIYQLSQRRPDFMRGLIRKVNAGALPEGYDVDTHFKPRYDPWDQRLCLVPDGDLFRALRRGNAEMVTDTIDRFVPEGIRLSSGQVLEADLVVTATGLNLQIFGGARITVDGEHVDPGKAMAYKGMMLADVPNFAFVIGYTNASWTLKADLVSEYVVRLLGHLRRTGARVCVPRRDPSVHEEPLLDFDAGYVLRSAQEIPKQGDRAPWRLRQNYLRDALTMRRSKVDDGVMEFS